MVESGGWMGLVGWGWMVRWMVVDKRVMCFWIERVERLDR